MRVLEFQIDFVEVDPEALRLFEKMRERGMMEAPEVPELSYWLEPVYKAFTDLSRSRLVGFAANPLTVSDIEAYLRLRGITDLDERLEWFDLLKMLDNHWYLMRSDNKDNDSNA